MENFSAISLHTPTI